MAGTTKQRLYRGLTPDQLAAERRDRLHGAALELFSNQGYANSPIELICATAKVATRHFYDQFDGREALLRSLFDEITAELGERIGTGLEDETQPLALRVSSAVHAGVVFLLDDPRRARIYSMESVGVSPEMEKHRRQTIHQIASLVEQYAGSLAASGELPQRDYHLPAVAVAGMINELMVEWLVSENGLSAGEIAREAVILLRAIVTGARHYEPVEAKSDIK